MGAGRWGGRRCRSLALRITDLAAQRRMLPQLLYRPVNESAHPLWRIAPFAVHYMDGQRCGVGAGVSDYNLTQCSARAPCTALKGMRPATIFHRQRQQIHIRQLAMAVDVGVVEIAGIAQTDVIGPHRVKSGAAGALEHGDQHGQWLRAAVARLAHDAKATVLRQRATGPPVRNVRLPPRRSTSSLLTIPPRVGNGLIPYIANRCDTGGADGAQGLLLALCGLFCCKQAHSPSPQWTKTQKRG